MLLATLCILTVLLVMRRRLSAPRTLDDLRHLAELSRALRFLKRHVAEATARSAAVASTSAGLLLTYRLEERGGLYHHRFTLGRTGDPLTDPEAGLVVSFLRKLLDKEHVVFWGVQTDCGDYLFGFTLEKAQHLAYMEAAVLKPRNVQAVRSDCWARAEDYSFYRVQEILSAA
jgi:hypothetical protein